MKKIPRLLAVSVSWFSMGLLSTAFYVALWIEFGDRPHAFIESACSFFVLAWVACAVHVFRARRIRAGGETQEEK